MKTISCNTAAQAPSTINWHLIVEQLSFSGLAPGETRLLLYLLRQSCDGISRESSAQCACEIGVSQRTAKTWLSRLVGSGFAEEVGASHGRGVKELRVLDGRGELLAVPAPIRLLTRRNVELVAGGATLVRSDAVECISGAKIAPQPPHVAQKLDHEVQKSGDGSAGGINAAMVNLLAAMTERMAALESRIAQFESAMFKSGAVYNDAAEGAAAADNRRDLDFSDRGENCIELPSWIFEQTLAPGPFRLLCQLHMKAKGTGVCCSSQRVLAEDCGAKKCDTLRCWLAELEEAGLVAIQRSNYVRGADKIHLLTPKPACVVQEQAVFDMDVSGAKIAPQQSPVTQKLDYKVQKSGDSLNSSSLSISLNKSLTAFFTEDELGQVEGQYPLRSDVRSIAVRLIDYYLRQNMPERISVGQLVNWVKMERKPEYKQVSKAETVAFPTPQGTDKDDTRQLLLELDAQINRAKQALSELDDRPSPDISIEEWQAVQHKNTAWGHDFRCARGLLADLETQRAQLAYNRAYNG